MQSCNIHLSDTTFIIEAFDSAKPGVYFEDVTRLDGPTILSPDDARLLACILLAAADKTESKDANNGCT